MPVTTNVFGRFLHRIPRLFSDETRIAGGADPGILAITADVSFYSCVLNAACSAGWTADWAPSIGRGLNICGTKEVRIVVFDRNMPYINWRTAVRQFGRTEPHPRILVASADVDEDLWSVVIRLGGYDVLPRSASSAQLGRELRFASLSLCESASPDARPW